MSKSRLSQQQWWAEVTSPAVPVMAGHVSLSSSECHQKKCFIQIFTAQCFHWALCKHAVWTAATRGFSEFSELTQLHLWQFFFLFFCNAVTTNDFFQICFEKNVNAAQLSGPWSGSRTIGFQMVPALHLLWANNFNKCKAHLKQTSKLLMKTLFKSCHRWQMSAHVMERFVSVNGAASRADTSLCPTHLQWLNLSQSEPFTLEREQAASNWKQRTSVKQEKQVWETVWGGFMAERLNLTCRNRPVMWMASRYWNTLCSRWCHFICVIVMDTIFSLSDSLV